MAQESNDKIGKYLTHGDIDRDKFSLLEYFIVERLSGTVDGTNTKFRLSSPAYPYALFVFDDGLAKAIDVDYILTDNINITFFTAPAVSSVLIAHYIKLKG